MNACQPQHRFPGRRARAAAVLVGALLAVLFASGEAVLPFAGAQESSEGAQPAFPEPIARLQRDQRACEVRVDSLLQARAVLRQESDSLGALLASQEAAGTLDTDRERALLGRLGAVSEADDRLSERLRREESRCLNLAADLLSAIRSRLAGDSGDLPDAVRQGLVRLRDDLRAIDMPSGRIDVGLPEAAGGDGVEDLRLRADLARDLADRLRSWVLYVNRQRDVVEERLTVEREMDELLSDQSLMGNDLRGDDLLGTVGQPGAGAGAWLDAGLDAGTMATIEQLCSQADLAFDDRPPTETLMALAEWLQLRRAVFLLRAEQLERAASSLAEEDRE